MRYQDLDLSYAIPLQDYIDYWKIENWSPRLIRYNYRPLFRKIGDDFFFLSLPELYPPETVLVERRKKFHKITSIDQLNIRTIPKVLKHRRGFTEYLRAGDYVFCEFKQYCLKYDLFPDIFRHYLSNHIMGRCLLEGDILAIPLTSNPFLTFILMPNTLYGKEYQVSDLMKCFNNRPFTFNGDYTSFFDYEFYGTGDKGKAVTVTAIYNMFEYSELVKIGFPLEEGRLFPGKPILGYEPFLALFLGYYHPNRNNSLFHLEYCFDIGILKVFKKQGLLMGRDQPYQHKTTIYKN